MNAHNPKKLEILKEIQLVPDEKILINGLQSGCQKTFQKVYKMYSPALLGVITRIVNVEEVANDLLQEVFIKIWNSFDKYDASKGRLFTWMISMTRNLAIDHLRSKAHLQETKRSPIDDVEDYQLAEHKVQLNPDTIGIKALASHLKRSEKEVLDLIYFQGYTHVETAEALNIPLGTVKTKLRAAIQKLRKFFVKADFEGEKSA